MREMSLYCSDLHCCCFTRNFATQIRGNWNQDTKFMALIDSIEEVGPDRVRKKGFKAE